MILARVIYDLSCFSKQRVRRRFPEFPNMLDQFIKHRLKLKENNKPGAFTLKIVLNGIFGRTNSIYSALYEPSLHGSVCGQLIMYFVAYIRYFIINFI